MVKPSLDEIFSQSSQNSNSQKPSLESIFSPVSENVSSNNETLPIAQNTSPLSFSSRLGLAFAGSDANKENVLKKNYKYVQRLPNMKFAVGNDPSQLQPIDPEGVFNDVLGDLADVANWVAPVTLSSTLATAALPLDAATMSPLPSIGMAGLGMEGGEAINQLIGRGIGVRNDTPQEAYKGLLGAAGVGMLTQGAGKAIDVGIEKVGSPLLSKAVDKARASLPSSTIDKFDAVLAKTLKVVAGIDEAATQVGSKLGFNNLFTKKNMAPGEMTNITTSFINGVGETEAKLGGILDNSIKELHSITGGKPVIGVAPSFQQMTDSLKEMRLLHNGNFINKNYPNGADKSFFEKLFSELGARKQVKTIPVEGIFGQNVRKETMARFVSPPEKIPVNKLISIKREFSSQFDKLSPQAQRVYVNLFDGLMGETSKISEKVGYTGFQEANSEMASFLKSKDSLRGYGLDPSNPLATNNFLSNVINHPDIVQQELKNFNSTIGNNFLERSQMWSAAKEFSKSNPSAYKLAMVSGLLGMSIGGGSADQRLGRGALYAAFALPGGLPTALKVGENLGGLVAQAKMNKMNATLAPILGMLKNQGIKSAGYGLSQSSNKNNS